jgi:hypothetical protein
MNYEEHWLSQEGAQLDDFARAHQEMREHAANAGSGEEQSCTMTRFINPYFKQRRRLISAVTTVKTGTPVANIASISLRRGATTSTATCATN